jgi:hypothetical protein
LASGQYVRAQIFALSVSSKQEKNTKPSTNEVFFFFSSVHNLHWGSPACTAVMQELADGDT